MIFKNLFGKKKWQSDKVSERIAAISELNKSEPSAKQILHELAFNDGEQTVRRAALAHLDDFSLYWQASKKDPSDEIKKFSLKNIKKSLLTEDASLPLKDKATFISECTNSQLIDDIKFDLPKTELIETALARLGKEHLYIDAIVQDKVSAMVAKKFISQLDDVSKLKKLSKKVSGELLTAVNDRLSRIETDKLNKQNAEKNLTLLLAKINALKDINDYAPLSEQFENLSKVWAQRQPLLLGLDAHLQQEMTSKYQAIELAIQNKLQPLREVYLSEQEAQQQKQKLAEIVEVLTAQIDDFEHELSQLIKNDGEISLGLTERLTDLAGQVTDAEISQQLRQQLQSKLDKLQRRLIDLPKAKAMQAEAGRVIEQLQKLVLPTDLLSLNLMNGSFKTFKGQWIELSRSGVLSDSVNVAYQDVLRQLESSVKPLEQEQNKLFKQFKRKQMELMDVIKAGRFHESFGLFKKLQGWHEQLNDYQQGQVAKAWQANCDEVEKLRELEQAIASPKREELIQQITQLAEQPLIDPSEQAHRVKVLRSDWLSLGRLDKEDPLNIAFNEQSEKAFSVCREFYAEQEAEREAAYQAKLIIIEQLEVLAENLANQQVASWKEIEALHQKLTSLWFETGLVDKAKVAECNQRFNAANKRIKAKIAENHANNYQQKEQLLKSAENIAQGDTPLNEKAQQLKNLQAKWKLIGHAGAKHDNKVWSAFRKVNNEIFDQLSEQRDDFKKASAEQKKVILDSLHSIENGLKAASTLKEISDAEAQLSALSFDKKALSKADYEQVATSREHLNKLVLKAKSDEKSNQQNRQYKDLFDAVRALASGNSFDAANIKNAWLNALNNQRKTDRKELTIKLEVVAEHESPESDKALRQSVQMQMMSDKLEQGLSYSLDDLLEQWLSAGPIQVSDVALIDRIEKLFIK